MVYVKYFISLLFIVLGLVSCTEKSLQKYLVEKQDDEHFVKMDLAASLLQGAENNFSEEETKTLSTIKKVNVVAYPISNGDTINFEKERTDIKAILAQEQYKELARINNDHWDVTLKYTGEEDAINEVIIFGSDEKRGFAVFRVLGKNMRPDQILNLLQTADKKDLDFSKFGSLDGIFKD
jgi:hypothetical protein